MALHLHWPWHGGPDFRVEDTLTDEMTRVMRNDEMTRGMSARTRGRLVAYSWLDLLPYFKSYSKYYGMTAVSLIAKLNLVCRARHLLLSY
eukprot:SAG31_NODE_11536_length_1019_cov_8.467391_1_plen_90_part_00